MVGFHSFLLDALDFSGLIDLDLADSNLDAVISLSRMLSVLKGTHTMLKTTILRI